MVILTLAQLRQVNRLVKEDTTGVIIEDDPLWPDSILLTVWYNADTVIRRITKEGAIKNATR